MAFFCPVRIRKGKKKKENDQRILDSWTPGRITGSSSIETLVRIGLEKENGISNESKMIVLHDFVPCVDDELEVKRGQIVSVLYQENDWVYVIADNNSEGFIPHSYCAPVTSQLAQMVRHKKLPRNVRDPLADRGKDGVDSTYSQTGADIHPFYKDPVGKYVALYSFIAREENDVSVDRGEFLTVLNKDDPDWFWVSRSDSREGFVPSSYLCPMDMTSMKHSSEIMPQTQVITGTTTATTKADSSENSDILGDIRGMGISRSMDSVNTYKGSELLMLYDYEAQAPNDLTMRRGDWICADLSNQVVDGWLWAYAPKFRKYGFVPKAYTKIPAYSAI